MIDVKKELVNALKEATDLKVYYELFVDSNTPTPCITYLENKNTENKTSDIYGYSNIGFAIKI